MAARLTVEEWFERLRKADRFKKDFGGSDRWAVYRDYYRGKFPNFRGATNGTLPYNISFSIVRTLVPAIYYRNPHVMVTPKAGSATHEHAKLVESVDNWLIQELEVEQAFKTAILDACTCGRGILKLGYDSQYGFDTDKVLTELGITDATDTQVSASGKESLEFDVTMKPGMPWVSRVDPDMFLVPFGTRREKAAEWVDHIIIRPTEDIKLDKKYSNVRDLKGTHLDKTLLTRQKTKFYEEMMKDCHLTEFHEIRDARRREVFCIANGVEKHIRGPHEDPLQIEGMPYVTFMFNEDPEYFWCPSDLRIIEPQQLEMNEARTQALRHRRLALARIFARRGSMSIEEADKMLREDVAAVIWMDKDPDEAIKIVQQAHIPPELLSWVREIRQDVREILGLSRQAMGATTESGRRITATEVSVTQSGTELRLGEKRNVVANALKEVIRKLNQIVFSFWDKAHVVQVVGNDGAKYWVEYEGAAIRNEYNLKVDVESMTPATKALRRQEIVSVMQVLAKNPSANMDALLKMLVREFDWANVMEVFPEAEETQKGPMKTRDFVNQQRGLSGEETTRRRGSNFEASGAALSGMGR